MSSAAPGKRRAVVFGGGGKKKRKMSTGGGAEDGAGEEDEGSIGGCKIPRGWQLVRRVKEDHNQALFGLAINLYDPRRQNLFATTGANRATVYELLDDGGIQVRQVYVDGDKNESFFCCAWSVECGSGDSVLAIAGQLGLIRVVNIQQHKVTRTLVGHGNSINDVRFHPYKPALLLSASKDESIRLWNVDTCACVALFTGDGGHRGEVLTIDFHLDGMRFVSAGMDNAIKVWSLQQCETAIKKAETFDRNAPEESYQWKKNGVSGKEDNKAMSSGAFSSSANQKPVQSADSKDASSGAEKGGSKSVAASQSAGSKRAGAAAESNRGELPTTREPIPLPLAGLQASGRFRSAIIQVPLFSTARIHRNYVDSVRWFGDLLLTKSTHNKVVIWKPAPSKAAGQDAALVINELLYANSDIWFLRFNMDPSLTFLALGNKVGQIYLWDLTKIGGGRETIKLSHSHCVSTIRQTAISADSRTILAVTDDASVWRWDAAR